ncbi:hypothetical protein [Methylophilus medardicus]|uniref:Uncharacterized protein n=1 Tax=Methylophilus medardicus TaxID=2588534 RepID=A0A5B8CT70_9PROT|nr:hypothetical protein [Methylophilus medardicus]QDC44419.1 hypothetical protein FIU01_07685 [Methylophilus medardicus]QDC49426.1 hypothetical protein FIU00_07685 [Methylophilus medardicus]QDC53131.1 hypothetical protein FIT99_07685 [Methylophilus medardicus]
MCKFLLALWVTFGLMSYAQAEESVEQESVVNQMHQNHFLGKRPYAKAPIAKQNPDEKWVGAGIVTDKPEPGFDKHQQMRLNFIGKRPYTAGSSAD